MSDSVWRIYCCVCGKEGDACSRGPWLSCQPGWHLWHRTDDNYLYVCSNKCIAEWEKTAPSETYDLRALYMSAQIELTDAVKRIDELRKEVKRLSDRIYDIGVEQAVENGALVRENEQLRNKLAWLMNLKFVETNKGEVQATLRYEVTARCPRGVYEHYQGGLYVLYGYSVAEVTCEPIVHYYSIEKGYRWIRTVSDWDGPYEGEGVSHISERFRFVRKATREELLRAAGLEEEL